MAILVWFSRLFGARLYPKQSKKIYAFTQAAYEKNGGATKDLKRVYRAYLENQNKGKIV